MEYTGKDLIIATGAPGSRWSGSLRAITTNVDINTSDEHEDLIYDNDPGTTNRKTTIGWHRGAYWGPYHKQGQNFDNIDKMSKDEIISEFRKPFADFNPGIKIIKSHWFAYHLDFLKETFPDAKFLAVYMPDDFCFDWWHSVGGWKITYPHYDWYKDDERMKKQISIENNNIKKFFELKSYSAKDTFKALGLSDMCKPLDELFKQDYKFEELMTEYEKDFDGLLDMVISNRQMGIL